MRIKLLSLLMAAAFPMRMAADAPAAAPVESGNDAGGASSVEQSVAETPAPAALASNGAGEQGNVEAALTGGSSQQPSATPLISQSSPDTASGTSPSVVDAPEVAPESGEGSASPAAAESASDTSSSASNASPVDAIPEANASDAQGDEAAEPDHKSILETLLGDLEGIVHMAKSEIIAVIDRAKSLL
ncbi:putative ATPase [Paraburkholderia tropica]